jgi:hypothetical protein
MANAEFCKSIHALAKLADTSPRPRPPPAFVDRFWQQAHLRSGRLAPGESTLLLWAVARMGMEAPPRWLASELAQAQRALPHYKPDQLVNTIVSLARMGRAPAAAWMGAFEAAARMEEFGMQEIVNVLWALRQLGYSPSLAWQHACVTALRAACAEACAQEEPLGAEQVGGLLEEAGLLGVLAEAVAAQHAQDLAVAGGGCTGGGARGAAGGGASGNDNCPIDFGFELPLGAT